MKLDIISDLHIDFYVTSKNPDDKKAKKMISYFIDNMLPLKGKVGDVLIIAGDISHYNTQTKILLEQLKEVYKYIAIVHGNHDLYLVSDAQAKKYEWESSQRITELKNICEELDVYFLDGDVIDIDGVRIGGTAGWYDLQAPGQIAHWEQSLNDSNLIFSGYPIYGAYSYGARGKPNWDTNKFYRDQLAKLKSISEEGCDILVTHIAQVIPPDYALPTIYRGDPGNIFYYVDNFDLVKASGCEYHVYGHTHDYQEFDREQITMICNPLGYPQEANRTRVKQIEI